LKRIHSSKVMLPLWRGGLPANGFGKANLVGLSVAMPSRCTFPIAEFFVTPSVRPISPADHPSAHISRRIFSRAFGQAMLMPPSHLASPVPLGHRSDARVLQSGDVQGKPWGAHYESADYREKSDIPGICGVLAPRATWRIRYGRGREVSPVCTENFVRVDDVTKSPKLAG
jgi:hypothetical protein